MLEGKKIGRGILYIAFGNRYRQEAEKSIASLRRFHADLPCCVIADAPLQNAPPLVQVILRDRETEYPFRAKPRYLRESPFDKTLFLDTDTTIVREFDEVFHLLDRFDIGLHMLPHYTNHPKYRYLNSISSGVVLYRDCEAVEQTFDRWLELFDEAASTFSSSAGRLNADPHLIRAIYDTQVRMIPLPAALNFHLEIPTVTASPIHIVHGRHQDPVGLAHRIEEGRPAGLPNCWRPRVWVPQLQTPLPDGRLLGLRIWLHAPLYALHAAASRLWQRVRVLLRS